MHKSVVAALLVLAAANAGAQGVYKYTDRDGRVVYTDDPRAGGGQARRVENHSSSVTPAAGAGPASRGLLEDADRRETALDRAVDEVAAAHAGLREAEERKEAGVEPIEGERQGRRFRDEYWFRQEALQRDVDTARWRLNDAHARRNALR